MLIINTCSKLDLVLEEVVQEHLKQPKKGDEELEYDLVDALINVMENGDLEITITTDIIKSVISVYLLLI
jgi:hypothetical protein